MSDLTLKVLLVSTSLILLLVCFISILGVVLGLMQVVPGTVAILGMGSIGFICACGADKFRD